MLFNSYAFIMVFLPGALLGYYVSGRINATSAAAWLTLCSLAFYAYWNVVFVSMLLVSIAFNFTMGQILLASSETGSQRRLNGLLAFGVGVNLLPLFYFKYLGTILAFAQTLTLVSPRFDTSIILPLGISFFTFTQIGYLVDCQQGEGRDLGIIRYGLFVSFFPHLIAGPLLHVREIGTQLLNPATFRLRADNFAFGATYFIIGLSKKVVFADQFADLVAIGFQRPDHFALFDSWLYALAYAIQLYFDFSGYSDMAIGLAAMFGIRFPLNFNSPYKARSIIDFWQRWHMTLTRYLSLLLYNPLALAITRRRMRKKLPLYGRGTPSAGAFLGMVVVPIFFTMILAGIWHGSGLQFLAFGLLHACYLAINHAWRGYRPPHPPSSRAVAAVSVVWQVLLTFVAVLVAQVFFRANSAGDALHLLAGMAGLHGVEPLAVSVSVVGVLDHLGGLGRFLTQTHHILGFRTNASVPSLVRVAACLAVIWALPNSQRIMALIMPPDNQAERETQTMAPQPGTLAPAGVAALAGVLFAADLLLLQQTKVFLYFQF